MDDYVKKPECSVRKKGRSLKGGPKGRAHPKREGMNGKKGFFTISPKAVAVETGSP